MSTEQNADRFADLGDIEPEDAELPHELPQQRAGAGYLEIEVPIAMSPAEVERRADAVAETSRGTELPPSIEPQTEPLDGEARP
jgi:hypothetical protein